MKPIMSRPRRGFSLMEMIVATAILAGSGAALFTLIGQGSQFGRRAEEQATALQLAQSVLDEALAMPSEIDEQATFEQDPRWAYRMERDPLAGGSEMSGSATASGQTTPPGSTLVRVTVEVFPAAERRTVTGTESDRATCRLVRLVRVPQATSDEPVSPSPSIP